MGQAFSEAADEHEVRRNLPLLRKTLNQGGTELAFDGNEFDIRFLRLFFKTDKSKSSASTKAPPGSPKRSRATTAGLSSSTTVDTQESWRPKKTAAKKGLGNAGWESTLSCGENRAKVS